MLIRLRPFRVARLLEVWRRRMMQAAKPAVAIVPEKHPGERMPCCAPITTCIYHDAQSLSLNNARFS
jgi:hypothetical protein